MTAPGRLCLECSRPIPRSQGSRCPACRKEREGRRPNAKARGYGSEWKATRRRFLKAFPVCRDCGAHATEVHHLDGQGPNGPAGHDPANLMPLCKSCHSQRTARDQPGGWHGEAA